MFFLKAGSPSRDYYLLQKSDMDASNAMETSANRRSMSHDITTIVNDDSQKILYLFNPDNGLHIDQIGYSGHEERNLFVSNRIFYFT